MSRSRQPKGIPVGGQFAPSSHDEAVPMVSDISDAPRDGTVIDLLVDGDWYPAYWSPEAYDGSPYGTQGWAQVDDGYLILDPEGWRESAEERVIDVEGDRALAAEAERAAAEEDAREERRRENARSREQTRRNREYLEGRHLALTGESPEHMRMAELRRIVRDLEAERSREKLSSVMSSFGTRLR